MRINENQAATLLALTQSVGDVEVNEAPEYPGSIGCTILNAEKAPDGHHSLYIGADGSTQSSGGRDG